ncbi:MAG: acetolactate synthase small subunit [Lachnospiraceae bacterium]|nr:acetolactate synthase small subunit [Lachnospiraceae bacterium]
MRQRVLSLLVENTAGVLSRVAGLFSRRGYNIDSLTVGETRDPKYSRMTVALRGDDQIITQIRAQLLKLEDVISVDELIDGESVCRELVLVKLMADKQQKQDIIAIADVFRAKIVDVGLSSIMVELTGNTNKINAFLTLLDDYVIKQIVRTGLTGLTRGNFDVTEE